MQGQPTRRTLRGWVDKARSHKIVLVAIIIGTVSISAVAVYFYYYNNVFGVPLSACGTTEQLLSVSPVQPDDISTIVPLGNFGPSGGHVIALQSSHIYLNYLSESSNTSVPRPVTIYAPAAITVYQIFEFNQSNGGNTPSYTDYKVAFAVCAQVGGYFIHVMNMSSTLKNAFNSAPFSSPGTKNINVKLSPGEAIGTAGGNANWPANLDFGLVDQRVPAGTVANIARYSSYELHYVCPLDYFPTDITDVLYAKLGNFQGQLLNIDSPKCGNVYQDLPGTAQGVWLEKNTVTSNSEPIWNDGNGQLDLGISNFNHTIQVVSLSTSLGQQLGIPVSVYPYEFVPQTSGSNATNRLYSSILPGSTVYCFQASLPQTPPQQIAVIVQLIDSSTLRLGELNSTYCGSGPWQFSPSYIDFIR